MHGGLDGKGYQGSARQAGPGRIWHHRRTSRPAVTGDVRPELWMARSGRPLPARAAAAREGIAGVFRNLLIVRRIRDYTWCIFSMCNLISR